MESALESGSGEDIRVSGTLGKEMYYYALLLDDGTVLRVSKLMDGLVSTALRMLPVICILAAVMLVMAWLMAKWQTARLIKMFIRDRYNALYVSAIRSLNNFFTVMHLTRI